MPVDQELLKACQDGDLILFNEKLEQENININEADDEGFNPLLIATQYNKIEIVKQLLLLPQIQINFSNQRGTTALMIACLQGLEDIVKELLQHSEIDVNQSNIDNYSFPLLLTDIYKIKQRQIVELLLQHKDIDVNKQNNEGTTLLQLAIQQLNIEIIKLLIQQKEIKIEQFQKQQLFLISCELGELELFEKFQNDEEVDINQQVQFEDIYQQVRLNPFILACKYGHYQIVKSLLEDKRLVKEEFLSIGFIEASSSGYIEIFQELLKYPELDINYVNTWFQYGKANNALLRACKNNQIKIVEHLMQNEKLDINISHQGQNALFLARDHQDLFSLLLTHKNIDVNYKNDDGLPLLHMLVDSDNVHAFKCLIERDDIDANLVDKDGLNILMYLVNKWQINNKFNIALESKKVDLNYQNKQGNTLLLMILLQNHFQLKEIIKFLLSEESININLQNNNGQSALILACLNKDQEIIDLLSSDSKLVLTEQESILFKQLDLMNHIERGEIEEIKKILQEEKIDVNHQFADGDFYLKKIIFASQNNKEILELFLQNESLLINKTDNRDRTAIYYAIVQNKPDLVELLLSHKQLDINYPFNEESPLMVAVKQENLEIIHLLVENPKLEIGRGLAQACTLGNKDILKMFLDDPKIQYKINQLYIINEGIYSPLMIAAIFTPSILEDLLTNQYIDVNFRDQEDESALMKTSLESLEILLKDERVDVNAKNIEGQTLLHKLAFLNMVLNIDLLLKDARVKIDEVDNNGKNALNYAICFKEKQVMEMGVIKKFEFFSQEAAKQLILSKLFNLDILKQTCEKVEFRDELFNLEKVLNEIIENKSELSEDQQPLIQLYDEYLKQKLSE